jgi:hypothetical protein
MTRFVGGAWIMLKGAARCALQTWLENAEASLGTTLSIQEREKQGQQAAGQDAPLCWSVRHTCHCYRPSRTRA